MKWISDIIDRDTIQDLWGEGYTIIRRRMGDPFYVDDRIIPRGMSYQWNAPGTVGTNGWRAVPASRHDGLYAPAEYTDVIEIGGLVLCEKAHADVHDERAAKVRAAVEQAERWIGDAEAQGFSGHVRVGTDEDALRTNIGKPAPENESKIPLELTPYIIEILRERDDVVKRLCPDGEAALGVKVAALQIAIDTIRERRKDELHAQATG